MNKVSAHTDSGGFRHAGLPAKITGLVFWGLVLVGLTLTFLLLRVVERQAVDAYAANATRLAIEMDRYLAKRPVAAPAELQSRMQELCGILGLHAAELHIGAGTWRCGRQDADLVQRSRTVRLEPATPAAGERRAVVTYFHPKLEATLAQKRKELLIVMGALFVAFGFALQWILQKLLSQPFLGMVRTAQQCSVGLIATRFDDSRGDEFGYLAKFINKALDYVTLQQDELREALARVRESESALAREKERAVVTLHSIADGVITTDERGNVEYINPVAERLVGCRQQDVRGEPIDTLLHLVDETTRERVENPVMTCLRKSEVVDRADHVALLSRNGGELAIADCAAPIRDRSGRLLGAIMVFNDIGHARKLARQLTFQASHDALTGLYNRREFEQQLQVTIEGECRDGQRHAVCFLDLDQFKVVNDTCGHVAGDELLRQLANLLHSQVRESDLLARLGGDEFGILLKQCTPDQAQRIAEDLRAKVKDFRFVWGDHSFEVGVSIGMVAVDEETVSIAEVMSAADVACYAAKDSGRNRVHVYQPDDSELAQRRGEMRWVSRLRKAIDNDRFVLYYQPIVPVAQESDGGMHFEVLIRLLDEDGTEVPPMAFIPAAERYNLMSSIDRWVLQTTLRSLDGLSGSSDWICVINLSGQSLCDDDFLEFVMAEFQRGSVDPSHICFEITETAAIANLRRARHFLKELKSMGCRFALDDFGSGLSSFAYLKNLRVDYLKIDGGFVKDMVEDPIDRAMVEAITQIGHVMGIQTIAEFVENEDILGALHQLGVDYAQGYWVAVPRPLADLVGTVPAAVTGSLAG